MQAMERLRRGWVAALFLSLPITSAAAAQPQRVAGTRVMLQPPEKFVVAERFPGFQRDSVGASIMVTEVEAPFRQLAARLTAEGLASRGMQLRSADSLTIDGRAARLLAVTQEASGVTFDKWLVVFGNDSATVIVTATYPQQFAATLGDPMRQAVLSSRLSATGPADPLEGIGFEFDPGSRMRISKRVGNMVLLDDTGTFPNPDSTAPLLAIGSSISTGDMTDLEGFARRRVTQTDGVSGIANLRGEALTIDGKAAYQLIGDGVDTDTSTPLKVFQVVIAEGDHYMLVLGFVGANRAAEFIPEFQAITRTVRRTQ
jgi:hypothetical protein